MLRVSSSEEGEEEEELEFSIYIYGCGYALIETWFNCEYYSTIVPFAILFVISENSHNFMRNWKNRTNSNQYFELEITSIEYFILS